MALKWLRDATMFVQVTNAAGVLANRLSAKLALLVNGMSLLPWAAEPASVRFVSRTDGSSIVDVDLATLRMGRAHCDVVLQQSSEARCI